jgi:hypothetical protein
LEHFILKLNGAITMNLNGYWRKNLPFSCKKELYIKALEGFIPYPGEN